MLYDRKWDLKPDQRVLLDAAEYIRQHGWCQHTYVNLDGAVCLRGAINMIVTERKDQFDCDPYLEAGARLGKYIYEKHGYATVTGWNDVVGRTKEEALAALEGAALA